jgi:hypothetical protein
MKVENVLHVKMVDLESKLGNLEDLLVVQIILIVNIQFNLIN